MAYRKGVPRDEATRRRISRSLKAVYANRKELIVRNIHEYKDPYRYRERSMMILEKRSEFLDFYYHLKKRNLSVGTIYKELNNLNRLNLSLVLNQDLFKIDSMEIADATKNCLRSTLKAYYIFKGKESEVWDLRIKSISRKEQALTLKEIKRVVNTGVDHEERTFLAVLWEGMFRISELLTVKEENIKFDNGAMFLLVSGKKGPRTVPIMKDNRLYPLNSYVMMQKHLKKRKKTRIWTLQAYNQVEYRMRRLRRMLQMKNLHTHLFRKSRATWLDDQEVSLNHIRILGGWSVNSEALLRSYISTSAHELLPILSRYNLTREKEKVN